MLRAASLCWADFRAWRQRDGDPPGYGRLNLAAHKLRMIVAGA